MSMRELRNELRATRGLLAAAKCPNTNCVDGGIAHRISEVHWEHEQCQWCAERSELLAEGY